MNQTDPILARFIDVGFLKVVCVFLENLPTVYRAIISGTVVRVHVGGLWNICNCQVTLWNKSSTNLYYANTT